MVSDAYRHIENTVSTALTLQSDFVSELAHKLEHPSSTIEHALYLTCVSCSMRPLEVAHTVNEFLVHVSEATTPPEAEQPQPPEPISPFIGGEPR